MTTAAPAIRTSDAAPVDLSASRRRTPLELLTCPNPQVESLYRSRQVTLEDGRRLPMNVFIPREQGDFLYSMVRHLRPRTTLEVGMANGISTLFIAAALRDNASGLHIAIDPFQSSEWQNAGVALLKIAGLSSWIEVRESYSHRALPVMEESRTRVQFAFVDGAHLFDFVIADFLCIDRILDVGGLIAFDDSDWPAVRRALRFILANRAYEVAFPQVVIEPRRPTPTSAARLARALGRLMPKLGTKLRPDFLVPDEQLGLRGRCIVLRKLAEDSRDSQSRCHVEF